MIFSDLHSAPCAEVNGLLDELAKARHLHIQKLFKHAPAHTDALAAHEAVLAAGAQGRFLEMQNLLFQQPKPSGSVLLDLARTLGLDLARFQTALDGHQFRDVVLRDIAEAQGLGVKITPTVFLNGTRFEGLDALRSLMRGGVAPDWESLPVETLQLDFISSPSSGPPDAPVTLIEFTDFRCGFCQIHSQILAELTAAYPGKIRRIFKHYPLQMEGPGLLPHLASIKALDQGKFWELHEAMMAKPIAEGQPSVLDRAQSVGISADAFQQAISDPRARALVQRDRAEGERLGIRATPTTFVTGRRLVGRQSLEDLKRYVDAILSGSHAATAPVVAGGTAKTAVGSLLSMPALVNHAGVPQAETCCGDLPFPARSQPATGVGVAQPFSQPSQGEAK